MSAVECCEEEDSNSRESLSLAEYAYILLILSLRYFTDSYKDIDSYFKPGGWRLHILATIVSKF